MPPRDQRVALARRRVVELGATKLENTARNPYPLRRDAVGLAYHVVVLLGPGSTLLVSHLAVAADRYRLPGPFAPDLVATEVSRQPVTPRALP